MTAPRTWTLARAAVASGLVLYVVVVFWLTLSPGETDPDYWLSGCLVCGAVGSADALKNTLFFVPLGALSALAFRRTWWAALPAAGLSVTVEALQYFVPGRDANPGDLLFNTLGALLGVALVRSAHRWLVPHGHGAALTWSAFVCLTLAGFGALQAPSIPVSPYSQQWTPEPDASPGYAGRVLEAEIGPHPFVDDDLDPDRELEPALLADALRRGAPIRLRMVVGQHRPTEAALLRAQDRERRRIFQVGVRGWDLAVGVRSGLSDVRVFEHDQVIRGALAGLAPGDTAEIRVERRDGAFCAEVGGRVRGCGRPPTPGAVWRAIEPRADRIVGRRTMDALTVTLLLLPIGWWAVGWSVRLPLAATVAGTLAAVSALTDLAWGGWWEWLGVPAGVLLGAALRAALRRTRPAPDPVPETQDLSGQPLVAAGPTGGGHGS